jgi:PAS domain S-box-containing protein
VGNKQFLIPIEGTADAALAVDVAGRITAWNKAAAELFGLSEADAVGVPCHQILQCSTEDEAARSEDCVITRIARESRPLVNFDLRLQTKTGRHWCNLSTLIVREPASAASHIIYIVRPREMRKRLEQALSEFVRTQARNGVSGAPTISYPPQPGINAPLTSREVEVLRSLARGHSTRAIASQLNISSATVNNHIKHILRKLDVHSRLEAIRNAETAGVI